MLTADHVPDGPWWHLVLESLRSKVQTVNRVHQESQGLASNITSISSLAQSCTKLRNVVRQNRQHAGFLLQDAASAKACGRCVARLQVCSDITLCFSKTSDPALCLGVFMLAADGPATLRVRKLHIAGATLDAAMTLLLVKMLPHVLGCVIGTKNSSFKVPGEVNALSCLAGLWPGLRCLSCGLTSSAIHPALSPLAQLTNLQFLELRATKPSDAANAQAVEPVVLAPLSVLTGLTHLSLGLSLANPLPEPADWTWLRGMQGLRVLSVFGGRNATLDGRMGVALAALPSLEELQVDCVDEPSLLDGLSGWCLRAVRRVRLHMAKNLSCLGAEALAVRRCPRAKLDEPTIFIELAVPASDSRQQLAAKLRALQALSGRGWLDGIRTLKISSFSGSVEALAMVKRDLVAGGGGSRSFCALLPHLGMLIMDPSVSPAHAAWLLARMPNLHVVHCGYNAFPMLSCLACLMEVYLLLPQAGGVDAQAVVGALQYLHVMPGRRVDVCVNRVLFPEPMRRELVARLEQRGLDLAWM